MRLKLNVLGIHYNSYRVEDNDVVSKDWFVIQSMKRYTISTLILCI